MLISRQINVMLAKNAPIDIVDAKKFIFQIRDVEPRNKLKIPEGLVCEGSVTLTGSETYVAQLPIDYDPASYLAVFCVASAPTLVTVTRNPTTSSNYIYVYGTNTEDEGVHPGCLSFQEKNITEITFRNVVGANDTQISWFMFQMPNLAAEGSWKDGVQTLGVIP
jgi:hypothetical protein